jgi:hypothetical protein
MTTDKPTPAASPAEGWTSTPPTEPGWYWAQLPPSHPPFVVRVAPLFTDEPERLVIWSDGDEREYYMHEAVHRGWLWWPVHLTPPEAP